jgi:hypothetical protein
MMRAMKPADLDEAVDLAFAAYHTRAVSEPTLERLRAIGMDTMARGLAIVGEEHGCIVACAGLVRREWDWSGEPYLIDRYFVANGAHAFGDLLSGCRQLARAARLPLFLGAMLNEGAETVARLYTINGGELVGTLVRFR